MRKAERLKGQCELSKLAVLLDDAKGKERREGRNGEMAAGREGAAQGAAAPMV